MSKQAQFEINVDLEQHSAIEVRCGGLQHLEQAFAGETHARTVVVIADENVSRIYGANVIGQFKRLAGRVESIVLPAGEATKSAARLFELWMQFAHWRLNRDALVVALGGGVVGDLAGLAAATYARGLSWIGLPTTLMAQVDSSIGGKVGLNLESAKNIVGAFWQPTRVLMDPNVLATLGEREYRSGLAEVVKYAVIQGQNLFERLERAAGALLIRDPSALVEIIIECCAAKVATVQADPFERTGQRAVLNYGHTFGHALENVMGYGHLMHGEAVALGMVCAARLSEQLGLADSGTCARQQGLLAKFGLPIELPRFNVDELLQAMALDKKNQAGKMRLALVKKLGQVELVNDVSAASIRQSLQANGA